MCSHENIISMHYAMYKLNDLPERNKISFYTVFFYEILFLCLYFLGTCFVKLKKK